MSRKFLFCLLVALASGAAALTHELLWTRRLVDLLGATGEATSRVLGCFFLGLSLGSWIAQRLLGRIKNPWWAFALTELAIAVTAVPAWLLPAWTDWIWPLLGTEHLVGWSGWLIKTLLSGMVVLPPSIAMGMTLPLLAAAALGNKAHLGRHGVWIYAANTLGGTIGLLLAGGYLLQTFGVWGAMATAIAVNVAIGASVLLVRDRSTPQSSQGDVRRQRRRQGKQSTPQATPEPLPLTAAMALAFFSGVCVLALEIHAIAMVGLISPSALQATMATLVTVILMLGLAAAATPWVLSWFASRAVLPVILTAAAVTCAAAPLLLYEQTMQLVDVPHLAEKANIRLRTTFEFQAYVTAVSLGSVGLAVFASGMVLPAVFAWFGGPAGDYAGRHWGLLLAANGAGGLTGMILAQYVIQPVVGIYQGFVVVALAYAGAAAGVIFPRQRRMLVMPALAAAMAIYLAVGPIAELPYLSPRARLSGRFKVESTRLGREGALVVVESTQRGRGMIQNNQYMLGSTRAAADQRRQAILPLLMHDEPRDVCCLGLATGHTAGAVLDYRPECRLTAVEISPLVVHTAEEFFSDAARGLFESPRGRVVVEDARTYMAAADVQFDVVIGDLYRPYGSGEGRLYSVEHFRNVRRSLREGGIFCQWLPMYQLTEDQFRIIAASFLDVFPTAHLIRGNRSTALPLLGLVAARDDEIARVDFTEKYRRHIAVAAPADPLLRDRALSSTWLQGRIDPAAFASVPRNTLDNALIEIRAGRERLVGRREYLRGNRWQALEKSLPSLILSETSRD